MAQACRRARIVTLKENSNKNPRKKTRLQRSNWLASKSFRSQLLFPKKTQSLSIKRRLQPILRCTPFDNSRRRRHWYQCLYRGRHDRSSHWLQGSSKWDGNESCEFWLQHSPLRKWSRTNKTWSLEYQKIHVEEHKPAYRMETQRKTKD